jgi:hypothetical protein
MGGERNKKKTPVNKNTWHPLLGAGSIRARLISKYTRFSGLAAVSDHARANRMTPNGVKS